MSDVPDLVELVSLEDNDYNEVEVVGRFDVKGLPGMVQAHEADQYIPSAWRGATEASYPNWTAQLFMSYEGIDSDLPEGEYFVVRRR